MIQLTTPDGYILVREKDIIAILVMHTTVYVELSNGIRHLVLQNTTHILNKLGYN